jgi:hypothetical protein
MLSKHLAKNLIFNLFTSFCLSSKAANLPPAEFTSVFSNYKVYPVSGDCGGLTLTLIRDNELRVIRGFLQTYEGNCQGTKIPITDIQLNKGTLSFVAAVYGQDGKGGLEKFAERRFSGIVGKNRVKGKIQYCPTDGKSCNSSEPIILPAVAHGTP